MDAADLQRLIDAANRAEHRDGACCFTLAVPSNHALAVEVLRRSRADDPRVVRSELVSRVMLELGIVGWDGVTVAHFVAREAGAVAEPVEFETELVPALLDAPGNAALAGRLLAALTALAERRAARHEAAAKN